MKKILVLIMVAFITVLVGCKSDGLQKNKYSFDLEVDVTELRESLVFNYTLVDEDDLLKNSEISYKVVNKETEASVKTGTLTISDKGEGSATVSSLTAATTYIATFTTGYKGKNILLVEKEVTTTNEGTLENPYKISTAQDLKNKLGNDRTAAFELTNDIDLNGEYISPIFKASTTFNGTFDGKGYKIKNYKTGTKDSTTSLSGTAYAGLFGYIGAKGVVKNVTFEGAELNLSRSSSANASIVAGYNCGTIDNVDVVDSKLFFRGSSDKVYYVGIIAGYNADHASVKNCDVDCDIELETTTGSIVAGGVIGYNESETELPIRNIISDCTFTGSISVVSSGNIKSSGTVEMAIGGIAGRNYSSILSCEATASITVKLESKKDSSSQEDATAIENYRVLVGGLVGQNVSDSAILDNSTATVSFDVEAKYASKVYVGGVAGQNGARDGSRALITNCTYKLPTDATNKLSVLNHTALGSVAANVIGNDLAHQSGVKTDAHTFTIDYYKFVEETLELDKTETINVAAITE